MIPHFSKNKFNQPVGFIVENWSPRLMPNGTNLYGKFCTLEPIDITKHAADLFAALALDNLGESWTYLPYGPFDTLEEFKNWLEKTSQDKETLLYTICDIEKSIPIGICGYLRINPEHGSIEIGHLHFSKLLKKTPAATEAMYLMMQHAFEDLRYRRYEWKCHSLNQPSRDAAIRLGFTFEGIFRQSNVFKGRNRDTAWFSIIDTEWPEIKRRFIQWLDLKNFDHNGNQRMRLGEI